MQERYRYCRYHEAPQRRRAWKRSLSWPWRVFSGIGRREDLGRKRIAPGQECTRLGTGWTIVYPECKEGKSR